jgi:hypothetical protein
MQRPRFRSDLVSRPLEENGQRFVDVTDPDSGKTFRFYEVEYAVACAMNGNRSVGDLIDWSRAELGLEPSEREVQTVISTLGDLGYLQSNGAGDMDLALGSPGKSPMDSGPPARKKAESFELGVAGKSPMDSGPAPREPAERFELGAAGFGSAEAPPLGGSGPMPTPTPTPPPHAFEAEPATPDDVSVDLSQHLQIGADDVKEAVRQSKVMEAVQMPPDMPDMPEMPDMHDMHDPAANQRPQQMRHEPSRPTGAAPIDLPGRGSRPAVPPPRAEPQPPPPRPRATSNLTVILLAVLLLAVVVAAAYYFFVYAKDDDTEGTKRPRGGGDAVEPSGDKPVVVVAMLKAGSVTESVITAPKAGKIEWIADAGTEVPAGEIVVKYKGFEKVKEKLKAAMESRDRYQAKLERAKEKDNKRQMASAAADVDRKNQDMANLQAKALEFAVKAEKVGVVTPLVEAGTTATEGQDLVKLTSNSGPTAVFEVADPGVHQIGAKVEIAVQSDPSLTAICEIKKIEGKKVAIGCPTDSGIDEGAAVALKPGPPSPAPEKDEVADDEELHEDDQDDDTP